MAAQLRCAARAPPVPAAEGRCGARLRRRSWPECCRAPLLRLQPPGTNRERAVATPSCDGEDHMHALAAGALKTAGLYSSECGFMVFTSSANISHSGKISSLSRRAVSFSASS